MNACIKKFARNRANFIEIMISFIQTEKPTLVKNRKRSYLENFVFSKSAINKLQFMI